MKSLFIFFSPFLSKKREMILKGVLRLFVSLYLYGKHNYKYISKVYLKHILQIYLICLFPAVVAPIRALRGGIYCTFLLIYTRSIRPDRRAVYCLDKLSAIASNSISMRKQFAKRSNRRKIVSPNISN